ncbi:MAG: tripartite tricarboxylate transporter TctB family protein [Betaproteobacteria bacterium]|nr:tripartite tricarboxylate transporter TctB family protein [Betaproteobacteria bacterium]
MSRRAQENLVAAALLALFAGVIWLAQDFGPRARMIPLPLAIFGIVLTVIQILWQNLRSTDELQMDMIAVQAPGAAGKPEGDAEAAGAPAKRVTWRQEAGAFGIVAALFGLIFVVGIVPAVFLFTGGYFRVTRLYSWRASLIYTAVLTAAVYLLFVVALQIQPYHGLLAPLVDHFR